MVALNDSDNFLTCTVVGDSGIGKTSMILKFVGKSIPEKLETTVFEHYAGHLKMEEEDYTISVFDCSSEKGCEGLRYFAYKDSDIFILCYNAMDRKSFRNIRNKWIPEITDFMGRKMPLILVATNIDQRDTIQFDQDAPVSKLEGEELACALCCADFVECSERNLQSVQNVFRTVTNNVLRYKKKKPNLVKRIFKR